MLTPAQRDRLDVVLVSPRNPLNIGAVARAMANFGFSQLTVAAPFTPHWREARSAVGAPELLQQAREADTLSQAVTSSTLVLGTGTLTYRKPEQPVIALPDLGPLVQRMFASGGSVALVFGPEKHGLTREDLSWCHAMVEIPTDARQPSMNLGQAVAVCLYELARPAPSNPDRRNPDPAVQTISEFPIRSVAGAVSSADLDRLADLIEHAMVAADYSPPAMRDANAHDLRVLLRRLSPSPLDTRRMLGLFRRILRRLQHPIR